MFELLGEAIKKSRLRSFCFISLCIIAILRFGIVDLALKNIVAFEWPVYDTLDPGLHILGVSLFLVAFFPPVSLRRRWFYVAFYAFAGLGGTMFSIMSSYGEERIPVWLAAVYFILFLGIFGSIVFGEKSGKNRMRAAIIVTAIILLCILIYIV